MIASERIHEQAMARVLDHMMADGRDEALFGAGPHRALDALRRFSTNEAKPSVLVELPLLGAPNYDVLVGLYRRPLKPGDRLADAAQSTAQAVVDWAAHWHGSKPLELMFELDADGGEGQRPGIHCRHKGQLGAADAFYEAVGEAWRAPLYRAVAQRAPQEWQCEYAALFPGRASQVTRIELGIEGAAQERAAGDPDYIRNCFDAMGFSSYDRPMLDAIAELIGMRPAHSLQFDILADGTLGDTFSLASFFENSVAATRTLFDEDGPVSALCRAYEQLGIADTRWHLLDGALLAAKGTCITEQGFQRVGYLSLPCCAKAKWKAARLQPGKFYLTASVV